MIVIVLVCIAAAALFAWVAIDHARFAIGDFRVPRPAIGPLRAPGTAQDVTRPSRPHEPSELAGEQSPPSEPAGEQSQAADERPPPPAGEDVEQRVRERLYGQRHGALRRAPDAKH
ncbi:MAG TPA: hypothetical protein VG410_10325 [Solirubrobacteraceae bacterium]|nr:hypothetical protein [Solirubrobacteraceae bacterium]